MTTKLNRARFWRPAFSLIELLVVMTVIGILATLTIPAMSGLMAAANVTRSAQLLNDQINLARQIAATRGRSVRVVLFQPDRVNYYAIQAFEERDPSKPLTKLAIFPEGYAVVPALSPLLEAISANTTTSGSIRVAGETEVPGRFFVIRASGRVEPTLTTGSTNFLTVARRLGTEFMTENYATIAVDPLHGRTAIYRP